MKNKNNAYNINDFYAWYRHNKPKEKKYYITEVEHNRLIREVFKTLTDHLVKGDIVQLGPFLGTFEMCEYDYEDRVYINKKGQFIDHRPVDWDIYNKKKRGELPQDTPHKWFKPIPVITWRKTNTAKLKNKYFLGFYVNDNLKRKAIESYNNNELYIRNTKKMYSREAYIIYSTWNRKK